MLTVFSKSPNSTLLFIYLFIAVLGKAKSYGRIAAAAPARSCGQPCFCTFCQQEPFHLPGSFSTSSPSPASACWTCLWKSDRVRTGRMLVQSRARPPALSCCVNMNEGGGVAPGNNELDKTTEKLKLRLWPESCESCNFLKGLFQTITRLEFPKELRHFQMAGTLLQPNSSQPFLDGPNILFDLVYPSVIKPLPVARTPFPTMTGLKRT